MKKYKFKKGDEVVCNGDLDTIIKVLKNNTEGYDYELKNHGTQSEQMLEPYKK